jgi:hypothetical protein
MTGNRTRAFPDRSIVVFDWLTMQDKNGAFEELTPARTAGLGPS